MGPMKLGQFIGPFELGSPLGEGGMAVVFHAWHYRDRTPVAIKVLKEGQSHTPSLDLSFALEVRAAASLNHPNMVAIYDHGTLNIAEAVGDPSLVGTPWLAMECIDGGSIKKLVGKTDWPTIQRMLIEVLDALAHAHARGLLHRDIKPGNILRDRTMGTVHLTDFGLSQSMLQIRSRASESEFVTGTPGFISPEQIHGSRRGQGPWSDIYSVGALGWTLATGRPPYIGEISEVLQAHVRGQLRAFVPACDVPPAFEAWLTRALQRNPMDRFLHAADAAWALRSIPAVLQGPPTLDTESDQQVWDSPTMVLPESEPTRPWPHGDEHAHAAQLPGPVHEFSGARPPFPASWAGEWKPRQHLHGAGLALYGLRTVALIGRRLERNMLWSGLKDCAASNRPRLTFVDGHNGVGKSMLMNWLAERTYELGLAQTLTLATNNGLGGVSRIGVMLAEHFRIERLSRQQAVDSVQEILAHLGVEDRGAAAALVQLARPGEHAPEGSDMRIHFGSTAEKLTLFCWYLSKLANDRPIVVLVEDLHEDPTAQVFLQQLLDTVKGPIFCLVSIQSLEAAEGPNGEQLETLRNHVRSQTIALKPLPGPDRIALLRELLGLDPSLAAQVEAETGGNPQFAVQLVGHWVSEDLLIEGARGFILREGASIQTPPSMLDMWVHRFSAVCSDATVDDVGAIELAAMFGNTVEEQAWEQALKKASLPRPNGLIERMARLRLLVVNRSRGTFEFAHAMFRSAIIQGSDRNGRTPRWASLAADVLATEPQSVRLHARLLVKAGRLHEALEPLAQAVEMEIDTGTRGGAQELFALREEISGAMDLSPRSQALFRSEILRWSLIAKRSERMEFIETHFDRLNGWSIELKDAHSQSRILRSYAYARFDCGKMNEGMDILERALTIAEETEAPTWSLCLYAKAGIQARMGKFELAIATTKEMLRIAEARGERVRAAEAYHHMYEIALQTESYDEAARLLQKVRQRFEAVGSRKGLANVALAEGEIHRARGDFEAAILAYKEAQMRGENCENSVALDARINLGIAYVSSNRFIQARSALDDALAMGGSELQVFLRTAIRLGHVNCLIAEGNWGTARSELSHLDTIFLKTRLVDRDFGELATLAARSADSAGHPAIARRAWDIALDQWERLGRTELVKEASRALDA